MSAPVQLADPARLAALLANGLSLERIGELVGRDGSTVGYWVKKHSLQAPNAARFSRRGAPDRDHLGELAAAGATLREMAIELDRSVATVRHWLRVWEIDRPPRTRRRADPAVDPAVVERVCSTHGLTRFRLDGRGYYRCLRCRQARVAERRRVMKRTLVAEAGGSCVVCGYAACPAALQFHHLDPTDKSFALSAEGVARSIAAARAEARKCVLLCANCHAEVEAGHRTL